MVVVYGPKLSQAETEALEDDIVELLLQVAQSKGERES